MRTALALSFVLALAACGSKAKPATTPTAERSMSTESAAPGGGSDGAVEDDGDSDGGSRGVDPDDEAQADTCGGGE